ncbi:biliverdin-producing heme oxygenase [Mucilaginibacter sp. CAU 1740]|uniref:biliverdin-producing heme oxygenase n=1 Tax=Mucilaginibacter sp. CAU 1740 TaxID=3140365 RepID=UPI00325AE96F
MLHEKIKQATASLHDKLEQNMFVGQIMDGSLTFEQYLIILHLNYGIHLAVEGFLFGGLSSELQHKLDIPNRIKLPALIKDLEEINTSMSSDIEGPPPNYIDLSSDASILGAMYVLEGATLGGNVIVKRLKTNEHLQPRNLNYHYYQVYGDQLGPKWKQFLEVLNDIPEAEHQAAINSAVRLFEQMASSRGAVKTVTVTLTPPPPPVGL